MTNKEYIKEHLKSLRKDFDIAIKNNLKDYANKLVEEIKCSENILKDLEILEILKPRIYIEEGLYREDYQDDRLKFDKNFFDSAEQENTIKEWLKETKEYEKYIEEKIEEFYDNCGIPKKYRNPNNIPGEIKIPTVTKNNLEKIKKNKGEKSMNNYYTNNQLLLQAQQNKAMEIIFNKCRDNVNLLLVNRNDTYDEYNSAFEYQMKTNVFELKEEDKLTIDEYIDIYEWLKSERIKNGLETVIEKEVDVTNVNANK